MTERANPFADLDNVVEPPAFQTKPKTSQPSNKSNIEQISIDQGFPSRKAQPVAVAKPVHRQRRYTTGRNQQMNFKAKPETIERFNRKADALNKTLCETLELALDALEKSATLR